MFMIQSPNLQYTVEYVHIDTALKARWHQFNELVHEISAFEPDPISAFEERRVEQMNRLRKMNPSSPDHELAAIVDTQISYAANPNVQFNQRFSDRFMAEYVTIAFLSHALCEAAINTIIAVGLACTKNIELFQLLERAEICEKWRLAPKALSSSYTFPSGTGLAETLKFLTKQRNAFVHYKVQMHIDGEEVLGGSKIKRHRYDEEIEWINRFLSLPYDLAQFAMAELKDIPMMVLHDRGPIRTHRAHVLAATQSTEK
jgi:hypothetical protein